MLYVTTKNTMDAHTANRALTQDRAADGGLYVPFRIPTFRQEQIIALRDMTLGQTVCALLQLFFGVKLESSRIDFLIGRQPVRLVPLAHKIIAAEPWRNPDWEVYRLVRSLATQLQNLPTLTDKASNWTGIAVRIAVLFGIYGQLQRMGFADGQNRVDLASEEGDLSWTVSAVYARKMGLPVGSIVCSCREDSPLWELYRNGQTSAKALRDSCENMQRLLFQVFGLEMTRQMNRSAAGNGSVFLEEGQLQLLRRELSLVVVSESRAGGIVPNMFRAGGYILSEEAALAYGGLLDFRSRSPERRPALLLCDRGPVHDAPILARYMNVSEQELHRLLHL